MKFTLRTIHRLRGVIAVISCVLIGLAVGMLGEVSYNRANPSDPRTYPRPGFWMGFISSVIGFILSYRRHWWGDDEL
jgi:hypothetical protein